MNAAPSFHVVQSFSEKYIGTQVNTKMLGMLKADLIDIGKLRRAEQRPCTQDEADYVRLCLQTLQHNYGFETYNRVMSEVYDEFK